MCGLTTPILGCTDPTACNYNPSANTDDGSCLTDYGCTDPTAFNYDPTATCDDGSCIAIVYGCTDPLQSIISLEQIQTMDRVVMCLVVQIHKL